MENFIFYEMSLVDHFFHSTFKNYLEISKPSKYFWNEKRS